MNLTAIPVYFSPALVADARSYSPSAGKPVRVVESWRRLTVPLDVRPPAPVTRAELYLAHDDDYVDAVLDGRIDNGFGNRLAEVAASLPYTSGAMLAAAREARANRIGAVAPVSGFHHACYDRGGGFCTFNGLMVAACVLLREDSRRIGILDFDHHYGNGTADIIRRLDLGEAVPHYTAGAEYESPRQAAEFLARIPSLVQRFAGCDVLLYQAGADPHIDDPLGGWLTTAQLRERDRLVFAHARALDIPVAWNLAGGYQQPLERVLVVHDNTMREAAEAWLPTASVAR
jgi:acetoin utilization deacetylase AcuC-like enzyme